MKYVLVKSLENPENMHNEDTRSAVIFDSEEKAYSEFRNQITKYAKETEYFPHKEGFYEGYEAEDERYEEGDITAYDFLKTINDALFVPDSELEDADSFSFYDNDVDEYAEAEADKDRFILDGYYKKMKFNFLNPEKKYPLYFKFEDFDDDDYPIHRDTFILCEAEEK